MRKLKSNCHVCGSTQSSLHWQSAKVHFNRCFDCEAVYVVPFPDEEELEKLYENSWKSLASAETGGVSNAGASFYLDKLQMHFKLKQNTLLDFGAGQGRLSYAFKRSGFRFFAYEPFGNSVVDENQLYIRTIDEIPKHCDFVVMFDVIEHLRSPVEVLSTLFKQIAPGAKIFISTPNPKSLNAILRGSKWREANKIGHLIFFTRKTSHVLASKLDCQLMEVGAWGLPNKGIFYNFLYRCLEFCGLGGATRFVLIKK
jgi:2-polyprenyl-3-methyl-5-hydroxy-6-metoxy-1,4-benzoquinol methylase